jgi:hypothetical protein
MPAPLSESPVLSANRFKDTRDQTKCFTATTKMDETERNAPLFHNPTPLEIRKADSSRVAYYLDMEGPRWVLPPLDGIKEVTGCVVRISASQVVRLLSSQVLDTLQSPEETIFTELQDPQVLRVNSMAYMNQIYPARSAAAMQSSYSRLV